MCAGIGTKPHHASVPRSPNDKLRNHGGTIMKKRRTLYQEDKMKRDTVREMMKAICLLLSVAVLFIFSTKADAEITWGKAYSAAGAKVIQQTSDGGYISIGLAPQNQALVLKLDVKGNIQWQKAYGFSDSFSNSWIQQTKDGGYIVAGTTGEGSSDVWVMKLDSQGNVQWGNSYDAGFADFLKSIQQTADGGYIVVGFTGASYPNGPWVMKLDASGNIQWQKDYGTDNTMLYSIRQTADNGYIAAGIYNGAGWLIKLGPEGGVQWQKAYSHNLGTGSYDYFTSIQNTSDGGYVATGTSFLYGIWTVKFDSTGNIQWQKGYGGDWGQSISQTVDGGYVLVGNWDSRLLKLDTNGAIEWYKSYGYSDYGGLLSVQQTLDSGYIVAGSLYSNMFVLKTDRGGNAYGCVRDLDETAVNTNAAQRDINEPVGDKNFSQKAMNIVPVDVNLMSQDICISQNNPPVANAGYDQTIELRSCSGITATSVTLDGSASYDPDGDALSYLWTWPGGSATGVNPVISVPYGTTTVTLTVDDGKGETSTDSINITVADTTPPSINLSATPNLLWPPNHKYVNVTPLVSVSDACTEKTKVVLISVTSNEPDNGLGDGDTANDIVINPDGSILLRAERSGTGSGRLYTITYRATDIAGNETIASTAVSVPHDMSGK